MRTALTTRLLQALEVSGVPVAEEHAFPPCTREVFIRHHRAPGGKHGPNSYRGVSGRQMAFSVRNKVNLISKLNRCLDKHHMFEKNFFETINSCVNNESQWILEKS